MNTNLKLFCGDQEVKGLNPPFSRVSSFDHWMELLMEFNFIYLEKICGQENVSPEVLSEHKQLGEFLLDSSQSLLLDSEDQQRLKDSIKMVKKQLKVHKIINDES